MATKGNGLCMVPLGFGLGMTFGLTALVFGVLAWLTGYGGDVVTTLSQFYHGYNATLAGAFVGFFWGFLDGFIGGVLIAYFYNKCCHYKHG